jgi:hypothetical protein
MIPSANNLIPVALTTLCAISEVCLPPKFPDNHSLPNSASAASVSPFSNPPRSDPGLYPPFPTSAPGCSR